MKSCPIYSEELAFALMDTALPVRQILATRGLSLFRVSERSREMFGRSSPFYVPHSLYGTLANSSLKPTIHQIFALSQITNYRLSDWLAVFGFDLDAIFRLQAAIPRTRTTLLDSTVYDIDGWIPWFKGATESDRIRPIAPVARLLLPSGTKRASRLIALNKRTFLYAMVGAEDVYAFPYFVPGSVIRVDSEPVERMLGRSISGDGPFFLVEHDLGWACSRLIPLGNDRVLLHCPQRPCAERELQVGRQARILGVIDAELRPMGRHRPAGVISKLTAARKSRRDRMGGPINLRGLLRHNRTNVGLSFREASSLSRWIAGMLSNEQYFTAASTLSDYETLAAPPRHVEKIFSLCLLYSIRFDEFLRASGFSVDQAGREPIPDEFAARQAPRRNRPLDASRNSGQEHGEFLFGLIHEWEEIPLFLRHSLGQLTGLKNLSLSDVFWVGGDKAQRHPLLVKATFIAVNRRARKPSSAEDAICGERLHLILKRDGSYACGRCTLDSGSLVMSERPGSTIDAEEYREGTDAEVVGQVAAILRRLM